MASRAVARDALALCALPLCLLGLIGKPAYRRARVFELGLSLLDLCRGQGLRSIHALVGLLQGRVQRLGRLEAHRFDEGRIHGRIQGVCTGIGDLGRYRSDLLVHVVIDVGFLEMAGRKRQEFCREIGRNDEGRRSSFPDLTWSMASS